MIDTKNGVGVSGVNADVTGGLPATLSKGLDEQARVFDDDRAFFRALQELGKDR
jgi:hypothetical protein